jgi:hypothetical protein
MFDKSGFPSDDIEQLLVNKLKSISVDQLQQTIAKAVSELVGTDYYCEIISLEYGSQSKGKGAEIRLKIREKEKELF